MRSVRTLGCWLAWSGLALAQLRPMAPTRQAPPVPQAQAPPPSGTGAIEGQILNQATGAPLKKASVRLFGSRTEPGVMPANAVRETDEQGRFSFASLPPGKYQLSAERQGFLRQ